MFLRWVSSSSTAITQLKNDQRGGAFTENEDDKDREGDSGAHRAERYVMRECQYDYKNDEA